MKECDNSKLGSDVPMYFSAFNSSCKCGDTFCGPFHFCATEVQIAAGNQSVAREILKYIHACVMVQIVETTYGKSPKN